MFVWQLATLKKIELKISRSQFLDLIHFELGWFLENRLVPRWKFLKIIKNFVQSVFMKFPKHKKKISAGKSKIAVKISTLKYSAYSLIRPCWVGFLCNYGRISFRMDNNKTSLLFNNILILYYSMNIIKRILFFFKYNLFKFLDEPTN